MISALAANAAERAHELPPRGRAVEADTRHVVRAVAVAPGTENLAPISPQSGESARWKGAPVSDQRSDASANVEAKWAGINARPRSIARELSIR